MAKSCLRPDHVRPLHQGYVSLLIFLAACAAPKATGPLLLHPVPPTAEQYALVQGALVFSGPEFTVTARPWDWRLVEEEFRRSGEPNPFAGKDGESGRFLFFRVGMENRSKSALIFNPMRSSVLGEGQAPIAPFENSDLFAFAGEDRAAEARGRVFRRVSFDGAENLPPGRSVERYLVFRSPAEAKLLVLEIDDLWLGARSYSLRFTFEAFKTP